MTIAETILDQLGGNRFIVMTGASQFSQDRNSLRFSLPSRAAKNRIRHCVITLTPEDTYNMEFGTAMGLKYRLIAEHQGVYCGQLQEVFTAETGLCIHL